jgi:hypothetical protein
MNLAHYLGFLHKSQVDLGGAFREVADVHPDDAAVFHTARRLAGQCDDHADRLQPFLERYGEDAPLEPDRLYSELFSGTREGPIGLLRDLHDLYIMVAEVDMSWTVVAQAAQGVRDSELLEVVQGCEQETATQLDWVRTQMQQAAPQALVAAE